MNITILAKTTFLLTLFRTGKVADTANQLNVSRPSVYQRLKSAEKEAGFKIFYRRGRGGLEPTGRGVKLLTMLALVEVSFLDYDDSEPSVIVKAPVIKL